MAHDHSDAAAVQASVQQMLPRSAQGWRSFTKAVVVSCLTVGAVLVFLLVAVYLPNR